MWHRVRPSERLSRRFRPGLDAIRSGSGGAVLLILAALTPIRVAYASDGVRDINQTCAVQTGCFDGDAVGFPVSISAAGSSRLTSDLVVPGENTDGIAVSSSDVAIDLNQFAIIRGACVGVTTNCTPASGTGSGVERTSSSLQGQSVRDGSIVGMGQYGVLLADHAEVQGVRTRSNRLVGVFMGANSIATGVRSAHIGTNGINTGSGSTVSEISASHNGGIGIVVGNGSAISRSAAYNKVSNGISGGAGVSCSGNSAYLNSADGISMGAGSSIIGNSAYTNGGDGIACGNGCIVHSYSVRNNADYGLNLGLDSAYRENVISGNTDGTVLGEGLVNLGNSCDGSAVCP